MVTRQQAVAALFAAMEATAAFKTATRRNRAPESFKPETTPALVLVTNSDEFEGEPPNLIRRLSLSAILYFDAGTDDSAIPDDAINAALDALDAVFAPDDPIADRCTLGGLIYNVYPAGKGKRAPGNVTGKGLSILPITMILD